MIIKLQFQESNNASLSTDLQNENTCFSQKIMNQNHATNRKNNFRFPVISQETKHLLFCISTSLKGLLLNSQHWQYNSTIQKRLLKSLHLAKILIQLMWWQLLILLISRIWVCKWTRIIRLRNREHKGAVSLWEEGWFQMIMDII